MARSKAVKVENNFSLGLVTETTLLKYPPNSCTETENCIFDSVGNVTRREGIDVEQSALFHSSTTVDGAVYVEYVWTSVGGDGDKSFLVIQEGNILSFFDISNSPLSVSGNKNIFTYTLTSSLPLGSLLIPGNYFCSFSNGRGRLVVTNKATDPFYIEYNKVLDSFSVVKIDVKYRDFEGVVPEVSITSNTFRPTTSVSSATSTLPKHLYNLYNQGWKETDALAQWDAARTDLPSNSDTISLFRASETDSFDPTKVTTKSSGNTVAPKGHFILTVGKEERSTVSGLNVDPGLTASLGFNNPALFNLRSFLIPNNSGGNNAGATTNSNLSLTDNSNLLDYSTTTGTFTPNSGTNGGAFASLNNSFAKNVNSNVQSVRIAFSSTKSSGNFGLSAVALRGVNGSAPTSPTQGTLLGSVTLTGSAADVVVVSSDTVTIWDYIIVNVQITVNAYDLNHTLTLTNSVNIVEFFKPASTSFSRPEVSTFFAGRVWYASNSYSDKGTNIYFSQVVQRLNQFGNCYQNNDPTSEQYFDLLSDDGGVISIPEVANVVSLFPMRSALVVLATNGTWIIRGSSSEGFSATSYRVEKISALGCVSRASVVDVKGLPYWAGEDGFYTVEYDPNYNAFQQKDLTILSINTFYSNIPADNRRFIKGVYDSTEQIVRFIYNDSPVLSTDSRYRFNRQLNYDVNTKAWYPWTFDDSTSASIRGIINIVDSNHVYEGRVKYIVTRDNLGTTYLSFAEQNQSNFIDWSTYAASHSLVPTDAKDYESYFITAPMMEQGSMRFSQANYLFVFLDALPNSSCKVSPRFDWTSSGSSGKWGTIQEAFGTGIDVRNVTIRRLKIRGKGRSIQFKFGSTPGKPFSILGWSIMESTNGGI